MKTSRIFVVASAALCAALFTACESPSSRIEKSPDVFARLTPDQQALVRVGQIAVGFDMDAVRLALGDPTRITIRTDSTGSHETWHYVTYEDAQGIVIYTGYYNRWRGWGGPRFWGDAGFYNGYPVRVHDRIRVTFDNNRRVAAIEQEKP